VTDSVAYTAVRLTHDSAAGFDATRARFDEQVPLLDPAVGIELVIGAAGWAEVEDAVRRTVGPAGLVTLARLDTGALLSLSGQPLDATLYLVGNPLVARQVTALDPAGALYAPFRVVVYRDTAGVHIAYDQPSSVFGSLGSASIDSIAAELDDKIRGVVEESCR